jgi:hypothetical protein
VTGSTSIPRRCIREGSSLRNSRMSTTTYNKDKNGIIYIKGLFTLHWASIKLKTNVQFINTLSVPERGLNGSKIFPPVFLRLCIKNDSLAASLCLLLKWEKDPFLDLSRCLILSVLCSRLPGAHSISGLRRISAQHHRCACLSFTFFRDNHSLAEGEQKRKKKQIQIKTK